MTLRPWELFFKEKIQKIFEEKHLIIDVGGSLRIDASRNNRRDTNNDWILPYLPKVEYKVLDKVADFHPDIVGNIHHLPLEDNSVDAIICIAVLEHVEEPQQAVREIYRVLKPGGYCFLYAPFLYYYHPDVGYCDDFYRFTIDGMRYMTQMFPVREECAVRGPITTALRLFPSLTRYEWVFTKLDQWLRPTSNQVSGFYFFCTK